MAASAVLWAQRRGEVVANNQKALAIRFSGGRCKNCTCGTNLASNLKGPSNAQTLTFAPGSVTNADDLIEGQNVLVRLPANRLRLATAAVFGLPVAGGLFGGMSAIGFAMSDLWQGVAALAGFVLGACASACIWQFMQRNFYDRLSIMPLDC